MQISIASKFDEIRRGSYISREDSNGEIRFIIRDLEKFWIFTEITILPFFQKLEFSRVLHDNFVKWKSNINIVLICEIQKFVLIEECPQEPPANASCTVRERYDSRIHSNNKARCYMLASMNNVLKKKHEDMETAYEI